MLDRIEKFLESTEHYGGLLIMLAFFACFATFVAVDAFHVSVISSQVVLRACVAGIITFPAMCVFGILLDRFRQPGGNQN